MAHIAEVAYEDGVIVLYDVSGNKLGQGASVLHAVANMYGHEYDATGPEIGTMPGVRRAHSGRWEVRVRNQWQGCYDTMEEADEVARERRAALKLRGKVG